MPSDSNGIYSLPPGYLAVTGETIQASQHNPPLEDLAEAVTNRLPRNGAAPMSGPLKLANGTVGAPALPFASAPNSGWFKTDAGWGLSVGGTLVLEIGANGIITGVTTNSIPDKAVTLQKLFHPSGPSKLLGSNSNAALTITGAANNGAGLIRVTVADSSSFATGQSKTVSDVLGTTEANGTWLITVIDATHIDLQGSSFTNAYISGGTIGGGFEELLLGSGLSLIGGTLSAIPQGYLFGLTCSNGADVANDITVSAGKCRDALDTKNLILTGMTKQLDSAWAAGSGAGGRSSAALADGTWHFFAIGKPNGQTDFFFHTALDPAGVLPTGYTVYRRVASFVRTAGSLLPFTQLGDFFRYKTPILDSLDPALGTVSVLKALTVPSGLVNQVLLELYAAGSASEIYIRAPGDTDGVPSILAAPMGVIRPIGNGLMGQGVFFTNTSAQLALRASASNTTIGLTTIGYWDRRGRDE
jgi:hypothetical protein